MLPVIQVMIMRKNFQSVRLCWMDGVIETSKFCVFLPFLQEQSVLKVTLMERNGHRSLSRALITQLYRVTEIPDSRILCHVTEKRALKINEITCVVLGDIGRWK